VDWGKVKIDKWQLGLMFLVSIGAIIAGILGLIKTSDTSPELGTALIVLGIVMCFICVRTYNRKV
jgi:hypothetical protein